AILTQRRPHGPPAGASDNGRLASAPAQQIGHRRGVADGPAVRNARTTRECFAYSARYGPAKNTRRVGSTANRSDAEQ
ncbi:MAG TPA: hypothetical protein PK752_12820, partial [Accumulibacter sp.]|uniref:hypothetical protein n=1 Tax=Accumulibacter sp. TaxID=2053492 RepID=UPI002CAF7C70